MGIELPLFIDYLKEDKNGSESTVSSYQRDLRRLDKYLAEKVFAGYEGVEMSPDEADVKGFDEFIVRYKAGLPIERAAVENLQ